MEPNYEHYNKNSEYLRAALGGEAQHAMSRNGSPVDAYRAYALVADRAYTAAGFPPHGTVIDEQSASDQLKNQIAALRGYEKPSEPKHRPSTDVLDI